MVDLNRCRGYLPPDSVWPQVAATVGHMAHSIPANVVWRTTWEVRPDEIFGGAELVASWLNSDRGTGRTLAGLRDHNAALAAGETALFVVEYSHMVDYCLNLAHHHHLAAIMASRSSRATIISYSSACHLRGSTRLRGRNLRFDHSVIESCLDLRPVYHALAIIDY